MVDSTAAYERDPGAAGYVPSDGVRNVGERGARASSQATDDLDGAGPEHASALLKMGALKLEAGAYSEAEELLRRALEIGERSLGSGNPALIPALTSLASARVLCGKLDFAQQLAVRAVAISENGLAEHEPDVAILINDLARLCLKESAYAVAEPLLLRLLEMKRSKGEDHPEVGTVLASLATVRHALGRHESAEQLWRRVLEIRERTLAPNHFSLAIALEHLAEACVARGKIGEALQLFQRAQTIRELTLGAGHPSLRIARDRIADLQLQAGESLDASHDAPAPAPEKYRLLAVNQIADKPSVVSAPPIVRERSAALRKGSARVIEHELKEEIAPPPPPPPAPPLRNMAASDTTPSQAESVAYRDLLLSIHQEMDDEAAGDATAPPQAGFLAWIAAELKQRQKATMIVVGVVATLAVLATVSRAWTEPDQATLGTEESLATAGPISTPSVEASSRSVTPANDPTNAPASAAAAATPVTESRIRLADQRTAAKKPTDTRAQPARIAIPKVSSALSAGFDSIVRARGGSGRADNEPLSVQPTFATPQRLTFERDDQSNPRLRAQLIGALPTPRYPAQLQGVEGQLTARFEVDALGRPVMSSVSVLNSPHELLTAAVLKVIPSIRFEPARSGGVDSKPVADVVQLTFRFQAAK